MIISDLVQYGTWQLLTHYTVCVISVIMLIIQCHDGPMDFKLSTLCSGVGTGGRGQGANVSTEGAWPPPPRHRAQYYYTWLVYIVLKIQSNTCRTCNISLRISSCTLVNDHCESYMTYNSIIIKTTPTSYDGCPRNVRYIYVPTPLLCMYHRHWFPR